MDRPNKNRPKTPQAETPGQLAEQRGLPGRSVGGDREWAQNRIANFFKGQQVGRIQRKPQDGASPPAANADADQKAKPASAPRGAQEHEAPKPGASVVRPAGQGDVTAAAGELKAAIADKGKSAVEKLLVSKGLTPEEVSLAEGAVKKDGQASSSDPTHQHKSADGSVRAPMTMGEKQALLKAHDAFLTDVTHGATVRKVMPNRDVGPMLHGEGLIPGPLPSSLPKVIPFDTMGGDIALAHHTDGLSAHETIAKVGLDYEHKPHDPHAQKPARGEFTDMDAGGKIAVSDEVRRNKLHYVDQAMSHEQVAAAKVPLAGDMFAHAGEHSSQPGRYTHKPRTSGQDNPYTGTGSTSSNALVDDSGKPFPARLNQEMSAGRNPYQPGATLKARGDAGKDQVIARYVPTGNAGGKPVCRWVLETGLPPKQRAYYESLIKQAQAAADGARAKAAARNDGGKS